MLTTYSIKIFHSFIIPLIVIAGIYTGHLSLKKIKAIYLAQQSVSNASNLEKGHNFNVSLSDINLNINQPNDDSLSLLKRELKLADEALKLAMYKKDKALSQSKELEDKVLKLETENSALSQKYKMRLEDLAHMTQAVKMHQAIDQFRFNDIEEVLGEDFK